MSATRHLRIIASLGPATSEPAEVRKLFEAGADLFCLDMRYGTRADHEAWIAMVRQLERETGRAAGLMMCLQGPRLRIGGFRQAGVELVPGQRFSFDLLPGLGDHSRVSLPYPEIHAAAKPGDRFMLGEGNIRLRAEAVEEGLVICRVESGGFVRDAVPVALPGVRLPIASLSAKDEEDLAFALEIGADWIVPGFVQDSHDVLALRQRIGERDCPRIMARLARSSALDGIEEIIRVSDAVMVCRADLAMELEVDEVPLAQRRAIRTCRQLDCPVVIGSQVLSSMVLSPAPTLPEASDVAAAVYDGADAILLSSETAVGRHGPKAVAVIGRIASRIEAEHEARQRSTRFGTKCTQAPARMGAKGKG